MDVNGHRHVPASLPRETPWDVLVRSLSGPRTQFGFGQEKPLLSLSGFEPTNRPAGNLVITLAGLAQLTSNTFMIEITNYALTCNVMCLKNIYTVVTMTVQT